MGQDKRQNMAAAFPSDSDSKDSEDGIRFKTESVRHKVSSSDGDGQINDRGKRRRRSRSRSKDRYHRNSSSRHRRSLRDRHGRKYQDRRSRHRSKSSSDENDRKNNRKKSQKSSKISNETDTRSSQKDEGRLFGPELPSKFRKKPAEQTSNQMSPCDVFGPALPPSLKKTEAKVEEDIDKSSKKENDSPGFVIGPTLPPHLQSSTSKEQEIIDVIGPVLPTQEKLPSNAESEETKSVSEEIKQVIGPILPPHFDQQIGEQDEESEEEIGPLPDGEKKLSKAQVALEERALQLQINRLNPEDKAPVREEWMLELPAAKATFGLGPRQFRQKAAPDMSDRSSWTSTPEDRKKEKAGETSVKVDVKKEAEQAEIKKRDAEQEKMAKKHKKGKESLVEMHQKKMKKQKQEEGPSERRPFSRELDLQVNRFDDAQKKAVLKKAQLLDTRFSSGESKYL